MSEIRTPIDLLRDRLHLLEEEVRPQLTEIDMLRDAIAKLEDSPSPTSVATPTPERDKRRVSVMPALEQILTAEPVRVFHARELVQLLEQRGIPMKQVNPENTVATAMTRLAEKGIVVKLGGNEFRAASENASEGDAPEEALPIAQEQDV